MEAGAQARGLPRVSLLPQPKRRIHWIPALWAPWSGVLAVCPPSALSPVPVGGVGALGAALELQDRQVRKQCRCFAPGRPGEPWGWAAACSGPACSW